MKKTSDIFLSEADLIHLLWLSSVLSIFLQITTLLGFFMAENNSIVYMPHFSYEFLCWLHHLVVVHGQFCSKHSHAGVSVVCWLKDLWVNIQNYNKLAYKEDLFLVFEKAPY